MKINLAVFLLLNCWLAWSLFEYGNIHPQENLILWLLCMFSFIICFIGWLNKIVGPNKEN